MRFYGTQPGEIAKAPTTGGIFTTMTDRHLRTHFAVAAGLVAGLFLALPDAAAQVTQPAEEIQEEITPAIKQESTSARTGRVLDAIGSTEEDASEIAKIFRLDELDLVFVRDLDQAGAQVADAVEEHSEGIDALRTAIQSNAIFYHALSSRNVAVENVVAVELGEEKTATVFISGPAPVE